MGLDALFPSEHDRFSKLASAEEFAPEQESGKQALKTLKPLEQQAADSTNEVRPGSLESAAIVLLTDGQNTTGPSPIEVAQMAASHGVKVFTVGIGTPEGTTISFNGWSMRVRLDEATLKQIADLTRGTYFRAGNGADLKAIYRTLRGRVVLQRRPTEITALFACAAGALMLVGTALSVWRFGRIA